MSTDTTLASSPSFQPARTWSAVLWWFFVINFGATALWLLTIPQVVIRPEIASYHLDSSMVALAQLPMAERISAAWGLVVRTAPVLVVLYHAIRVFGCFRKGEVFAAKPITHIRAAGLWTIIWAFSPTAALLIAQGDVRIKFEPPLLAFGIATFIAAHVMAEARRIADENASIL